MIQEAEVTLLERTGVVRTRSRCELLTKCGPSLSEGSLVPVDPV